MTGHSHSDEYERLQQRLIEFIYDLLPDDEAADLSEQITSDPDVARAYAEVKLQSHLLSRAAKCEQVRVDLQPPGEDDATAAQVGRALLPAEQTGKSARSTESGDGTRTPATAGDTIAARDTREQPAPVVAVTPVGTAWRRAANALVGLAAMALICLVGYAYFRPDSPVSDRVAEAAAERLARQHVRVVVTGPGRLQADATSRFTVATSSADGLPLPVPVEYMVFSPFGQILQEGGATTDEQGRLQIELPPNLSLINDSRLELFTSTVAGGQLRVSLPLEVDPVRFATHLSLDKPLYRPGETVFYRSLTLSRFGLKPDADVPIRFEILGPGGSIVPGSELKGATDRGVGNGRFDIPAHLPGGTYTLVARTPDDVYPLGTREFAIRQYRTPRLKKELELTRDSYAAGDKVVADFSAVRAEGGPAANARLTIQATVDGRPVAVDPPAAQTGADGTYRVEFTLPSDIERGDGTLAVVVDDGGTRETIAETIPINLGKVRVQFYPEGGDLVAGLENRVYFHAVDPLGKPVDIKAALVDGDGEEIARVETVKEGRGEFRFIPTVDDTYRWQISSPPDVENQPEVPKTTAGRWLVMDAGNGVFGPHDPVRLDVLSTKKNMPLVVNAVCRGAPVGQQEFVVRPGDDDASDKRQRTTVTVPLTPEAAGVVRLTVFDCSGLVPQPIAERLVYRRPAHRLDVELADNGEAPEFSPGDAVELTLQVSDETGDPVSATLGVAVVDDALLNLADDKSPQMTTHFLLSSEIEKPEDLEDVNFFLSEDPEAAEALDLLLGTQGWRRFAEMSLAELGELAMVTPESAGPPDPADEDIQQRRTALTRLVTMDGKDRPPVTRDNVTEVRERFQAALATIGQQRAEAAVSYGRLVFISGVALLVVLTILGAFKLAGDARVWVPAVVAAALCCILGITWVGAVPDTGGQIAFQSLPAFAPAERSVAMGDDRGERSALSQLSASSSESPTDLRERWFAEREFTKEQLKAIHDWKRLENGLGNIALDISPPFGGQEWDKSFIRVRELVDNIHMSRVVKANLAERQNQLATELAKRKEVMDRHGIRAELPADATPPKLEGVVTAVSDDGLLFEISIGSDDGLQAGHAVEVFTNQRYLGRLTIIKTTPNRSVGRIIPAYRKGEITKGARVATFLAPGPRALPPTFAVRTYAHVHRSGPPGVRTDFAEMLYWNPLLIADADGRATIKFDLSDSVTTFRVRADAHGAARIGSGEGEIVSRIPFSLEPKLPLEVNAGDRIDLPVAVNNDTDDPLPVELTFVAGELLELAGEPTRELGLPAGNRHREFFALDVTGQKGDAEIEVRGLAGNLADGVRKSVRVVPPGFPVSDSYAGQLTEDQTLVIPMPDDWVNGSLEVKLEAFPSSLADLQKGLDSILREPYGCFEQTSSSNYPNVLALIYMQEHDVADPAFTRRAKELLKKGYGRLTSFESPKKGYEWFGHDPGHEALTAYGLMEFRDMSAVWDVDQEMVDRTANWLMDRRDGEGGFQRNSRALDSFGRAPQQVTNAYIVWALTESGQDEIENEIEHVVALARESEDPYLIALAAAAAMNVDKKEVGAELLDRLAKHQQDDGHLEATDGTITRSGGLSMQMETTALAALAWLEEPRMRPNAERAVEWISNHRQGSGGFGSTQATILALKALIQHAKANRKTVSSGALYVKRGDEEIGRTEFGEGEKKAIVVGGLEADIRPGENDLTIGLTGDNDMPFVVDVSYRIHTPHSDEECPVRLKTTLAGETVDAGATVGLSVELSNVSGQGQPMTVAIVGLPAGLEPRVEQLDEKKEAGEFDYYEINARELIFYWRSLSPDARDAGRIAFDLDLVAEIPGRYTAPASRAYLYYTPDHKHWAEPLKIEIGRQ
jgi:hypothetical protein